MLVLSEVASVCEVKPALHMHDQSIPTVYYMVRPMERRVLILSNLMLRANREAAGHYIT